MIKKIKQFIQAVKRVKELEKEIEELKQLVGSPEIVVRKVLDRKIKFYDSSQIESEEHRRVYQRAVEDVLRNEAFKNESNAIIADCVEFCARESQDHNKTIEARMTINGLELLRQRLEDINLVGDKTNKKENHLDSLYNAHFN